MESPNFCHFISLLFSSRKVNPQGQNVSLDQLPFHFRDDDDDRVLKFTSRQKPFDRNIRAVHAYNTGDGLLPARMRVSVPRIVFYGFFFRATMTGIKQENC